VSAAVDRIDVSAPLGQPDPHRVVNVSKVFDRQDPSRNAGLVAADRDSAAGAIEARDSREAAVDGQPFGSVLDVARRVYVDDSVPIEQHERHEMFVSKMPFNVEVNHGHGQKRE
jgi:hypothetical protein